MFLRKNAYRPPHSTAAHWHTAIEAFGACIELEKLQQVPGSFAPEETHHSLARAQMACMLPSAAKLGTVWAGLRHPPVNVLLRKRRESSSKRSARRLESDKSDKGVQAWQEESPSTVICIVSTLDDLVLSINVVKRRIEGFMVQTLRNSDQVQNLLAGFSQHMEWGWRHK